MSENENGDGTTGNADSDETTDSHGVGVEFLNGLTTDSADSRSSIGFGVSGQMTNGNGDVESVKPFTMSILYPDDQIIVMLKTLSLIGDNIQPQDVRDIITAALTGEDDSGIDISVKTGSGMIVPISIRFANKEDAPTQRELELQVGAAMHQLFTDNASELIRYIMESVMLQSDAEDE